MGSIKITDTEMEVEGLSLTDVTLEIDPNGRELKYRNNSIVMTGGPIMQVTLSAPEKGSKPPKND